MVLKIRKEVGVVPIKILELEWQRQATDGNTLNKAAMTYLTETNTTSLTDAFREVRRFHAEYMANIRDFDERR